MIPSNIPSGSYHSQGKKVVVTPSKSSILKQRIYDLLKEKPHLRDDMHRTFAIILAQDVKAMKNPDGTLVDWDKMTAHQLISELAKGYESDLSNPESVRRLWQKVQQENNGKNGTINLRGENWHKRHGIQQVKKREEMRADEFKNHPVQHQSAPASITDHPSSNPTRE